MTHEFRSDVLTAEEAIAMVLKRPGMFRLHTREEIAAVWDEGFSKGFYRGQILPGDYDASEAGIENPYEVPGD